MLTTDLIKLNNLQLAGKLVSDELLLGVQTSRRSGTGTEFEQFRHYVPGDDPKRIDWKRFAQTDQYLVRESATESNQQVRLLIDLSGSMNYAENGISRLNYAKILLASLAYLSNRQADQLRLYGLHNGTLQTLVPPGKQAFQKIVSTLNVAEASGAWQNKQASFPEFGRKQAELLIIASDFLQVGDEWLNLIQQVAGPRREIVIFQLLGDHELTFDLSGFYRFQDLETGREVELQAEAIRDSVRERAAAYFSTLEQALRIPHVRLIRTRLSEPIAQVLTSYLTGRKS
ncbi:DUF58 domain-containing protein [Spirosoma utsteinense]|uniref:DUF58 domain-containing protein n=1 Tax=Spirosoma utsteinense TaxID=2585773 RepID=A0ABR6W5M8_9BACT|nr:DUF58 domain-containing protein [Spirosoma utsteinense]MBC3786275.1 putative protein (DUF58 family) [Spirosoma utsteinense]MBC3791901.1 putative protein (DUF58 family) [Spirosoma utsteinense]